MVVELTKEMKAERRQKRRATRRGKPHRRDYKSRLFETWNSLLWVQATAEFLVGYLGLVICTKHTTMKNFPLCVEIDGRSYILKRVFGIDFEIFGWSCSAAIYRFIIRPEHVSDASIHNTIWMKSMSHGYNFRKPVFFNRISKRLFYYLFSSRILKTEYDRSVYFHVTKKGRAVLTVRKINISDDFSCRCKIWAAWFVSCLLFWVPKNFRSILMFEKESSKYEEGASIVYERLLENGYRNVWFVITQEGLEQYPVPAAYLKNVVLKGTFRHYFHFFFARTFIATESTPHAIDLRTSHPAALQRIRKASMDYVFLQHGVTYMLSLASKFRLAFNYGHIFPKQTRFVVCSELEATHFVEGGRYPRDRLYVTGLPKFDRATRYEDADRIIVMPTWRPWEYNIIASDYTASGYYQMLLAILKGIPKNLHHRVLILPHPLFQGTLQESDLSCYLDPEISYELALRQCEVLITDYSSIAYDAFNRGAKVIFWWADRDDCMAHYGGHLMINEDTAFGPVVFSELDLLDMFSKFLEMPCEEEYTKRFRRIVYDFRGKSTDLLISQMRGDGII